MVIFSKFQGKLIKFNSKYPIYDENDLVIGYTEVGDMAVITYEDTDGDGYFEVIIVSGEYIGYDSLAISMDDVMESTFIIKGIGHSGCVQIKGQYVNYEYV